MGAEHCRWFRDSRKACVRWIAQLRLSDAAVWITENQVFLQGQAREVREFLPQVYYSELPRLSEGELAGFPRIYGLAVHLILCARGTLSKGAVAEFVNGYQTNTTLTMG